MQLACQSRGDAEALLSSLNVTTYGLVRNNEVYSRCKNLQRRDGDVPTWVTGKIVRGRGDMGEELPERWAEGQWIGKFFRLF